jgi:hypothetical protein
MEDMEKLEVMDQQDEDNLGNGIDIETDDNSQLITLVGGTVIGVVGTLVFGKISKAWKRHKAKKDEKEQVDEFMSDEEGETEEPKPKKKSTKQAPKEEIDEE